MIKVQDVQVSAACTICTVVSSFLGQDRDKLLSDAKEQLYCYILRICNDAGTLGMLYLPDRQPHFTFLLAPTLQVEALASVQLRDNVSEIEHNC